MKELRAGADPDAVIRLQRPAETERYKQQLTRLLRESLDIIEDVTLVKKEVVTPKGDVKTVEEPNVSEADRIKAIARAESLVEKIALVNSVSVKGVKADGEAGDGKGKDETAKPFTFNFSGRSIESLIGERIGRGGEGVN